MKKALIKDGFLEIKKTFGRFIALLAIIALGIAFFVGINTTSPDMKNTADVYYKDTNFMDFNLLSTAGFTKEEVKAVRDSGLVKEVMPSYSVDCVTILKEQERIFRITSLLDSESKAFLNKPQLLEGRYPQKSGECVIEQNPIAGIDYKIGDKIDFTSGNDTDLNDTLKTTSFTVVGIIRSPLYVAKDRGTTALGNGNVSAFMQINDTDFKSEYYTSLFMTAKLDDSYNAYSERYDDKIDEIKEVLEPFSDKQADLRQAKIKSEAQATLDDNTKEYNDAVKTANDELSSAKATISDNEKKLADGKKQLADGKVKLNKTLADSQKQLDDGFAKLKLGKLDYDKKLADFNLQKQQAIDSGHYDEQMELFAKSEGQLIAAKQTLDATQASLDKNQATLNKSRTDGLATLATKQRELDDAQKKLEDGKREYESKKLDADNELADAKQKLADAQVKINDIPKVTWYVLDRNTNVSYVDYGSAADRMTAISRVFPVIFVMIAILICLTSMSRMVEEQRSFMGTTKALGYSRGSVAFKFLLYAIIASAIGSVIGLIVGFTFFPAIIFRAYSTLYVMPELIMSVDFPLAVVCAVVAIATTVASAMFVCYSELNSNAAELMRPRAPKAGQTILLERIKFIWKRLTFIHKVTARNLFRYKSRFLMTIIGVSGCTALLLVGFGLRDSITSIGSKQYGELYKYEVTVQLKDDAKKADLENVLAQIKKQDGIKNTENNFVKTTTIGANDVEKSCNLTVPSDLNKLPEFVEMRDRKSHNPITLDDSGVILSEKLASMLDVNTGDNIYIKDGVDRINVKVSGICENYMNHFLYISPALYQKIYGEAHLSNQINIKLDSTESELTDNLYRNLIDVEAVSTINFISQNKAKFHDAIQSLYSIIFVLIVSAGMLSFIVLYTLTNINVNERMREIATIKVLGFYDREANSYVFRENIILSFIGSLVGVAIGVPLAKFVITTAEVEMMMFGRDIYFWSYLFSISLTMLFSFVVNLAMFKKIKNINMVEALKTVE